MIFPLLPYSQLVLDLIGESPGVYEIPVLLRMKASETDASLLDAAVRAAVRNHPVLSMRLDAAGHHPCILTDELQGPYHSIKIIEDNGQVVLSARFNRILGDLASLLILADDISRAYRGLELQPDRYTRYLENYWELRNSSRNATLKKWFDDEFGTLSCPVRPHTDTPPEGCPLRFFGIHDDILPYCGDVLHREHITPTGFVSLCAALAIMDCEGTDTAALTWAYAGRDSVEEQRIFGSLHRDIPFVIRRSSSPSELFRQARTQLRAGIAHSDYPYTLTPPHTEVWNYALNVLQQPDPAEVLSSFPFGIEVQAPVGDSPQPAYSLLDIELSETDEGRLALQYKYSSAHYRKESIERFASLMRANALWLLGGHHRVTRRLEEMLSSDAALADCIRKSIELAAERCPDLRMNPVRSLDGLYAFLDRFIVSMPWESLGLSEEMPLFQRIDQSTGYFLFLFDQPLKELEGKGLLYPSAQYIPAVAEWIKDFNSAWREHLDSPASWNGACLELVMSDPIFGLDRGWYEQAGKWKCWNDFFARRLSGPDARPTARSEVTAPVDGILQESWDIDGGSCLTAPEGVCLKTASARSVADLLDGSPYRESFAGGTFVHQTLDFYDYHRFHSPVDGTLLDVRTVSGISGSGGIVVWNSARKRYEYANPGEPGFQMLETRGVVVIDAGQRIGPVALVAVGMAQVCSVNWMPGVKPGRKVCKGEELGFFLCGGSDVVLLFRENANLHLVREPGRHLLMGEELLDLT